MITKKEPKRSRQSGRISKQIKMTRDEEFAPKNINPASRFLEWKSDHGCFQYQDVQKAKKFIEEGVDTKEAYAQETYQVELPLKFLLIRQPLATIKGYSDTHKSGIYSNEVRHIGTDVVKVKTFKRDFIAEGVYKQIKPIVKQHGGYYCNSLYCMAENGEIFNISLKGSSVSEWSEFYNKSKSRAKDEWIIVEGAEERTKGKVKFTVPVFKYESVISQNDAEMANEAFRTLYDYHQEYFNTQEVEKELQSAVDTYEMNQNRPPVPPNEVDAELAMHEAIAEEDDLPF